MWWNCTNFFRQLVLRWSNFLNRLRDHRRCECIFESNNNGSGNR
jgi:hypothetical protein